MIFTKKEDVEKEFFGKLCQIIGVGFDRYDNQPYRHWLYAVEHGPSNHIPIKQDNIPHKLIGTKIWWTRGMQPLLLKEDTAVLVVDIVRDNIHSPPSWAAVVLFEEQTFLISVENLFVDK